MTTPAIKAAEAELDAAKDAMKVASDAVDAARGAMNAAHSKLQAARLERDKALPKAIVRTHKRYSGRTEDVQVCIVRRTAKSVFVRVPGGEGDGAQYRQDRRGEWQQYPSESWGDGKQLIFGDDAKGVKP